MIHTQEILCIHCSKNDIVGHGYSTNGTKRWKCKSCDRTFQLEYRYKANEKGVKEKIDEMTLNSSGVMDITRTLGVCKNTVSSHLKKNTISKSISS